MTDRLWNPRYSNYARAHGRTEQEQLEVDKVKWPSACMLPFVQWNQARIIEASREIPAAFFCGGLVDHAAYDAWLTAYVDGIAK